MTVAVSPGQLVKLTIERAGEETLPDHYVLGRHLLKVWAKTQSLIALSSGESEFYASVKGASVGLGGVHIVVAVHLELHMGPFRGGEVHGVAHAVVRALGLRRMRSL